METANDPHSDRLTLVSSLVKDKLRTSMMGLFFAKIAD